MKFTFSWLKTHLDTNATPTEIADALTDLGLEVEDIVDPAQTLGAFTVGHVLSAEKHPDADRLRVCQVETDRGLRQIICGAPNARADIKVVVAHPGTYVPGIDTTIQIGKIRGVESHGMMCSEREMELGDAHDGIIELETGDAGMPFSDWLTANKPEAVDPMIEIAITPNRPDALGVEGIARDLAARGLGTKIDNPVQPIAGEFAAPISVSIDDDTLDGCPIFAGRVIRGVKNGPSPAWLQQALKAIGLRPISALVDITNFFTFDRNRPLHVFDADKVSGNLRVHRAQGGETIQALDDKDYTFQAGMMIISDGNGPESIAGVMGGADTAVSEDTVNVFVESAYWDPVTIARTGRALKINSDAKYRFERGVDPAFTLEGLELATQMVVELCGGSPSEIIVAGEVPDTDRAYPLDTERVASLVGMEIAPETQRKTLKALGFRLEGDMVHPPSWRPDVRGSADLVEEVARIASLTKLEAKPLPRVQVGVSRPVLTPMQKRGGVALRTLAALGYNECVTYSFIDRTSAELFGGGTSETSLENPISSEMSHMRPALLPGLLQVVARNQARGFLDLALFEAGPAFAGGEPGQEHLLATAVLVGQTAPKEHYGMRRNVDAMDSKGDLEVLLRELGAPAKVQILRGGDTWWHPGRHGQICLGPKKVIAEFGELHPGILQSMDIKGPAVALNVFLEEIPFPKSTATTRPALVLNDLQAVERDFAFVIDTNVEALALVNAAQGADKALIRSVRVFDEFTGPQAEMQMGPGKKSLAITVRIEPLDKTLTDEEIDEIGQKVVAKVSKATGGVLRG
ncbi:MAG: phenylalanine--tRNA ligase subunit beta [Pseudomonadota bacterium]